MQVWIFLPCQRPVSELTVWSGGWLRRDATVCCTGYMVAIIQTKFSEKMFVMSRSASKKKKLIPPFFPQCPSPSSTSIRCAYIFPNFISSIPHCRRGAKDQRNKKRVGEREKGVSRLTGGWFRKRKGGRATEEGVQIKRYCSLSLSLPLQGEAGLPGHTKESQTVNSKTSKKSPRILSFPNKHFHL